MKIQLNARNRAHHFDATPADKILYAGLSHGITLPYECGSGTCGTCKARLLSGEKDLVRRRGIEVMRAVSCVELNLHGAGREVRDQNGMW